MLTFIVAVFFLLVTPGPGVLSTAGVGSGFGYRPGLIYVAGLFVGTNAVALAVVTGLAAIVFSVPVLRTILMWMSMAYLIYLAAKIALSGSKVGFIEAQKAPGFWNGIALQAINPKAYAVNSALFTGFPIFPNSLLTETLLKFLAINAVWIPIHLAWLAAGVWLHRLALPGPQQRLINFAMAGALLTVVALAVWSLRSQGH